MWSCHRLVLAGVVTMTEVETLLSITDVFDLGIAYDALHDAMNPPQERG